MHTLRLQFNQLPKASLNSQENLSMTNIKQDIFKEKCLKDIKPLLYTNFKMYVK